MIAPYFQLINIKYHRVYANCKDVISLLMKSPCPVLNHDYGLHIFSRAGIAQIILINLKLEKKSRYFTFHSFLFYKQ